MGMLISHRNKSLGFELPSDLPSPWSEGSTPDWLFTLEFCGRFIVSPSRSMQDYPAEWIGPERVANSKTMLNFFPYFSFKRGGFPRLSSTF
jgi:hypothetical protein